MNFQGILDSSRETLVLLGIIILQVDLKFNRLCELSLFGIQSILQDIVDGLAERVSVDLRPGIMIIN